MSCDKLTGYLSGQSDLTGTLSGESELIGELSIPATIAPDKYDGPYEVVPAVDFQLLPTMEKLMEDDVIVHPVPYAEVSNIYGGYTATIGD